MIEKAIRDWLAAGLKKPGKSIQGLADYLDIDRSQVSRMLSSGSERNPRKISATELYAIANYISEPLPFGSRTTEVHAVLVPVIGPINAGAWHDPGFSWMQPAVQVPVVIESTYAHLAPHARRVEGSDFNAFFVYGDCPVFVPFWEVRKVPHDNDIVEIERTDSSGRKEVSLRRVRVTRQGYEFRHESLDAHWQQDVLTIKDINNLGNIEITGLYVGLFRPQTF